ncbi:MAG: ADP-forming succinate--CoA ligase subunit beta [Actinomycetota bacterium]|nr:ADP-forming succinate--CoA ligase subunit beta [Actinomycetota bacterium]
MDLLEFQGKEVLARYGVPTPDRGVVCRSSAEVEAAAQELGGRIVVKAQVKVGGRGKAGGIRLAEDPDEAREAAEAILGMNISGHAVELVYVERATQIAEEYYLSVVHDRQDPGYVVICSAEGGVDIEQVNRSRPGAVVQRHLVPSDVEGGFPRRTAVEILTEANIPGDLREQGVAVLVALFRAFRQGDAKLTEINPLVRTSDGLLVALDAKVTLDDNALFRHDEYRYYVEVDRHGDSLEAHAKRKGIQYVKLEGNVGVIGNGAGLVMATIDVVSQVGGKPANFLDVGGGASADKMADSLGLVLSDPDVSSVFINIYGGITRGEEIASGVLEAMGRLGVVRQRIVVRLDGTNAEQGRRILAEASHPNIVAIKTMLEAGEQAVAFANQT